MKKYYDIFDEILLFLKWGKISTEYFGFSPSWLYQRLKGYDGNGRPCELTEEQKATLRDALLDIADKITTAAEKL
ncbi:MAG: DUF5053 domain-containing protein [Muribaculaceae bacterium]|nr:DUF5053 domain-containing protein [Muribaculaceae bacterium]